MPGDLLEKPQAGGRNAGGDHGNTVNDSTMRQKTIAVVAYLLEANSFPAQSHELASTSDSPSRI
jgi:hypothetical protein